MEPTTSLAVSGPLLLAAAVALVAGAVSFASPCVVPLVPGYLAYLAGLVGAQAAAQRGAQPPVARRGGRGALRRGLHGGVRGDPRRGRLAGRRAGGQRGRPAARRWRRHDRYGAGVRRAHPGAAERAAGALGTPGWGCGARRCSARSSGWAGCPASARRSRGWSPSRRAPVAGRCAGWCSRWPTAPGLGVPFVLIALGASRAVRALGLLRRHTRTIQVGGGVLLVGRRGAAAHRAVGRLAGPAPDLRRLVRPGDLTGDHHGTARPRPGQTPGRPRVRTSCATPGARSRPCASRWSCCSCWRWPHCPGRCCRSARSTSRSSTATSPTTRRSRPGWTSSASSTSSPRRGSRRSTCC